jgi:hypothetical protein
MYEEIEERGIEIMSLASIYYIRFYDVFLFPNKRSRGIAIVVYESE